MSTVTLYLVDDQELFRAGMKMVLQSQPDLKVVGEAGDAERALVEIPHLRPNVVLMDIRMPGMGGIEATQRLLGEFGDAALTPPRVLMLTTLDTEDATRQALAVGADGFMLKDTEPEFLISAVRALAVGTHIIATSNAAAVTVREPVPAAFGQLTGREHDVFVQVAHGLSNREIAATLFVSEATVKTHLTSILQKLQLRDRVQVVIYAYRHGLAT